VGTNAIIFAMDGGLVLVVSACRWEVVKKVVDDDGDDDGRVKDVTVTHIVAASSRDKMIRIPMSN